MSDPAMALGGARVSGGGVVVSEAPATGMVTLKGDLSDSALRDGAGKTVGADFPDPRRVASGGGGHLLWMAPDEILILCDRNAVQGALDTLGQALSGRHHLAVDVSDARAVFTLEGDESALREVLARLAPADLSPADLSTGGLPRGEVRRTRLAQVPAAFWFTDSGEARVICFRSVAAYVFGLLTNAAAAGPVGHFSASSTD